MADTTPSSSAADESSMAWTEIPEESVAGILRHLPCLLDHAMFSGVCTRWRFIARMHPPPMLPWLFMPSSPESTFFCVVCEDFHPGPNILANLRGARRYCGSFDGGWLAAAEVRTVIQRNRAGAPNFILDNPALVNHCTGERVDLPSDLRDFVPRVSIMDHIHAIIPSEPPRHNHRYCVAAVVSGKPNIAFWRPDMENYWIPPMLKWRFSPHRVWVKLLSRDPIEDVKHCASPLGVGFHVLNTKEDIVVYAPNPNDKHGELTMSSVKTHRIRRSPHNPNMPDPGEVLARYLVPSRGDLLMVVRYAHTMGTVATATVAFEVFRLEEHAPSWIWNKLDFDALTDRTIFLRRCSSVAVDMLKPCPLYIYFLDDSERLHGDGTEPVHQVNTPFPCADSGKCCFYNQDIVRCLPRDPPSYSSPWFWFFLPQKKINATIKSPNVLEVKTSNVRLPPDIPVTSPDSPGVAWGQLPEESVVGILLNLPCLLDHNMFAGICKRWRFVAGQKPPPVLPWLFMPSASANSFFCIPCGQTHTGPRMTYKSLGARRFCGTFPGGWLAAAELPIEIPATADGAPAKPWKTPFLINLCTDDRVFLPRQIRDKYDHPDLAVIDLIRGVILSDDPHTERYIAAAVVSGCSGKPKPNIAFWRPDMCYWTPPMLEWDSPVEQWQKLLSEDPIEDVKYFGLGELGVGFYVLNSKEELLVYTPNPSDKPRELTMSSVKAFRIDRSPPPTMPEPGEVHARYLLQSRGDLLMVIRYVSAGNATVAFDVFKLVPNPPSSWSWKKLSLDALTDRSMILVRGCSLAIEMRKKPCPLYIYFLDDSAGFPGAGPFPCADTGKCCFFNQEIVRCLPGPGQPPSDYSPWTWFVLTRNESLREWTRHQKQEAEQRAQQETQTPPRSMSWLKAWAELPIRCLVGILCHLPGSISSLTPAAGKKLPGPFFTRR
uniref:KIB1-4 beta-propeller domain-containing protein n=1 Tax=Leersia perrieri TaxID=77586 RepID=A0A0D9VFC0_9ORYZ